MIVGANLKMYDIVRANDVAAAYYLPLRAVHLVKNRRLFDHVAARRMHHQVATGI